MKILILANDDVGLFQFRKELIEELLKDNQVIITLPYGEFVEYFLDFGCKFYDTPLDRRGINPLNDYKLYRQYRKILKKEKVDLVITYTIKPNIYGGYLCKKLTIPYVVNITGLGTAFQRDGILKKIVTTMYRVSCKNAKTVFFENEGNKQYFIDEQIIKDKQAYRLNGAGVNIEKYQVTNYPNGEKIKFLFMGRVMAEKGVDELFEATKKLIDEGINCELDILGNYEEDYRKRIEQYENEGWLHYYGFQKDVKPFIEKCHCFVLPSWHEGMANTNLECAASGRPVITTNIFGCKEAVEDGVTGYLCKKKDSSDLYKIMKRFINLSYEEKRNMGLAGRERMVKLFDKKNVVADTIEHLKI